MQREREREREREGSRHENSRPCNEKRNNAFHSTISNDFSPEISGLTHSLMRGSRIALQPSSLMNGMQNWPPLTSTAVHPFLSLSLSFLFTPCGRIAFLLLQQPPAARIQREEQEEGGKKTGCSLSHVTSLPFVYHPHPTSGGRIRKSETYL